MSQAANDMAVGRGMAVNHAGTAIRRIIAAVIALLCAVLLGVAAWLDPSPDGLGTHTQLIHQPCSWPVLMGIPCPTCGMTTSFAHAANGDIVQAFVAQPMGCLLALATAMTLLVSTFIAFTGSRVADRLGRIWGPWAAWWLGSLTLGAWVYKIVVFRMLVSHE